MIAPTSVSSRFSARPVMPPPKSSISLSITSPSPSILATPSPISRIVPTVCLAVAALAPAICSSISVSRSTIGHSLKPVRKPPKNVSPLPFRFQGCESGADTAVVDVAAHLDPDAADERGVLAKGHFERVAIRANKASFDVLAQLSRQRRGAFDQRCVPLVLETHQPLEICQHSQRPAARRPGQCSCDLARTVLIEDTGGSTEPEQLAPHSFDFLARSHRLASCCLHRELRRRLLRETTMIVRGQDLAGH